MTKPEQLPRDHDSYPTARSRRSRLWRLKIRLQFTGWLQYLITGAFAIVFLVAAAIGWLIGIWQPLLFWVPLMIGLLLLAAAIFDVITLKWGVRPTEPLPQRADDLDTFDLIRSRRSCHSFQSRDLTAADRAELMRAVDEFVQRDRLIGTGPIRLEYVAAPLTIWPGVGAHEFLVAIAPYSYDRLVLVDVGRSLQKVVLQATRMGVSTCWIGPGADQSSIVEHLGNRFDPAEDHVVCVCAVGYRSRFKPLFVRVMERISHRRLPLKSLFFSDPRCEVPLAIDTTPFSSFGRCYEVCQWSPSSYNAQTTRCAAVTELTSGEEKVVRLDFYTTTASRFYAPVALGIWCANWETGCDALGVRGHFAVLDADARGIGGGPELPRYDVSWIAGPEKSSSPPH
ncbi:nitroreductase [Rhodococcus sp. WMMA185]|uniref:nitroreductase family protein n=1 Tax=Rhodococcus sp. WMMA185 TaxID=679318 RepID=UPI000878743E|nr:nitroreductase family protein [Rhodococcus sp. WMMA185]AOW93252.1 nitroreductase [Rhodococcus sp. WMMA185]